MYDISKKKTILVCCGTGCLAHNSYKIYEDLKDKLKDNSNIAVEPIVKATGCNGLCEKGPVVKIHPDNISYFKVSAKDVDEIIEKTIINGQIIDRLLYIDVNQKKRIVNHMDASFYKHQHKIALRNIGEIDPLSIQDYIENDGYKALHKIGRAHVWTPVT